MSELFESRRTLAALAVVVLILLVATFKVVPETDQAVIVRFGEPVRVYNRFKPNQDFGGTGAGLIARIPFAERIVWVDKRVLDVDMEQQQILSTDQLRLEVDAYARYRIIDPVKMVQTAGTTDRVSEQLQPILSSVVRKELARNTFASLLTPERGAVMARIRQTLDQEAREYGAQVIDVRIKRADLPDGTPLESAFTRMATARSQEADTIRAQGSKSAQIIRAEAEAEASKIYAASFGKDPSFYDFYRAMQSYDTTFASQAGSTTIVLSPDNAYLKQFREGSAR